jgi:DNA-binding cell septation regulator SpoVG
MTTKIELSEIQITPIKPRNGLLAFCSFVINDSFYVGSVAIYSLLNGSGYRLAYPEKILPNGIKIDCFHPINREAAGAIEGPIIAAFEKLIEKGIAKGSA